MYKSEAILDRPWKTSAKNVKCKIVKGRRWEYEGNFGLVQTFQMFQILKIEKLKEGNFDLVQVWKHLRIF